MSAPEQFDEEAVRAALRAARHDEPMPPAVASRLDALLADLNATPRTPTGPGTPAGAEVIALTPRRRRGTATLVAAAAAVVAIASAPAWWPSSGPESLTASDRASESSARSAESPGLEDESHDNLQAAPSTASEPGGPPVASRSMPDEKAAPTQGASRWEHDNLTTDHVASLTSGTDLTGQVERLLATGVAADSAANPSPACSGPTGGIAVTLDGVPGWLTQRQLGSGSVATVVDCSGERLARIVLP